MLKNTSYVISCNGMQIYNDRSLLISNNPFGMWHGIEIFLVESPCLFPLGRLLEMKICQPLLKGEWNSQSRPMSANFGTSHFSLALSWESQPLTRPFPSLGFLLGVLAIFSGRMTYWWKAISYLVWCRNWYRILVSKTIELDLASLITLLSSLADFL